MWPAALKSMWAIWGLARSGFASASNGHNVLTGYAGVTGNYAIVDMNSSTTMPSAQADVYAYNNFFGNLTTSGIGYVILDHLDVPGYTTVLFSNATTVVTPADVYVYYGWAGSAADAALSIDGTSPTTGQYGYNEFANIQDAIDSVVSGSTGTVHVYFGTYTQNLVFSGTETDITLEGAGKYGSDNNSADTAPTIDPAAGTAITVNGAGNVLQGLTIDGSAGATAVLLNASASLSGDTIDGAIGIDVTAGSATILGSTIENNTTAGIQIESGASVTIGDGISGDGDTISGNAIGVNLLGTGSATITGATLTGNTIGVDVTASASASISGGSISGGSVGIQSAGTLQVENGASITGMTAGVGSLGYGIEDTGGMATVDDASIGNGSGGGNTTGIHVSGGTLSVQNGSTLTDNATGIEVHGGSATVVASTIAGSNTTVGIQVDSGATANIGNGTTGGQNTIESNAIGILVLNGTSGSPISVNDNLISGSTTAGVAVGDVNGDGRADLAGNTFTSNSTAIDVDSPASSVSSTDDSISGSTTAINVVAGSATVAGDSITGTGSASGIVVASGASATVENSGTTATTITGGKIGINSAGSLTVEQAMVSSPSQVALDVHGMSPVSGAGGYDIEVIAGTASIADATIGHFTGGNEAAGILLSGGSATLSSNTFEPLVKGLEVTGSGQATLSGNSFINNSTAIYMNSSALLSSTSDTISGSLTGIDVASGGSIQVAGDTLNQSGGSNGINVESGGMATIENNGTTATLIENGDIGILSAGALTVEQASGSASGQAALNVTNNNTAFDISGGTAHVHATGMTGNHKDVMEITAGSVAVDQGSTISVASGFDGINISGGRVTVGGDSGTTDTTISPATSGTGTGIAVSGMATATIDANVAISNLATGVSVSGQGVADITGAALTDNAVGVDVAATTASATISGGTISDDHPANGAVGVLSAGTLLFESGASVTGMTASSGSNGYGIEVTGGSATVDGSSVGNASGGGNTTGIYVSGGTLSVQHGATLTDNVTGLEVHGGSVTVTDSGTSISGGTTGVQVDSGASITIEDGATVSGAATGVDVKDSGSATLTGSTIGGTGAGNSVGVLLEGASSSVTGGDLKDNATGISITGSGDSATVATIEVATDGIGIDVSGTGATIARLLPTVNKITADPMSTDTTGILFRDHASGQASGLTITGMAEGVDVQGSGSGDITGTTVQNGTTGVVLEDFTPSGATNPDTHASVTGGDLKDNATGISITGSGDSATVATIEVATDGIGVDVSGIGAVISAQAAWGTISGDGTTTGIEFRDHATGQTTGLTISDMATGVEVDSGATATLGDGMHDDADVIDANSIGLDVANGGTATTDGDRIRGNSSIGIRSAGTLTVENAASVSGTTSGDGYGIEVTGGMATVEASTVGGAGIGDANTTGIYVSGGTLNVQDGAALTDNATGIEVAGGSVTATGTGTGAQTTISGGTTGVLIDAGQNVTIDGGATVSGAATGVDVKSGGTAILTGGTVQNSSVAGVLLEGSHDVLTGGMLTGNATGIDVTGTGASISGTSISGGTTGVYIGSAASATVSSSTINDPAGDGVDIAGTATLSGDTITDNGTGVVVEASGTLTSADHDTISGNSGDGIDILGTATLSYDTISGNATGVEVDSGGTLVSATNDAIIGNSGDGLLIDSSALSVGPITDNDLSGNGGKAVDNLSTTLTIDASLNYWGADTSEAAVKGETHGSVDYSPWLSGPSTDLSPGPGYQGSYSVLNVGTGGAQASGLIAEALADVTTGGTINVHGKNAAISASGIYSEDVNITKSLTLQAAAGQTGAAMPVIQGNSSASAVAINSAGVKVEGLAIDGAVGQWSMTIGAAVIDALLMGDVFAGMGLGNLETGNAENTITGDTFTAPDIADEEGGHPFEQYNDSPETTATTGEITSLVSSNSFSRGVYVHDGVMPIANYLPTIWADIQPAIEAASSGDTVIALAGTYAENVNVDKALTLLGPNAGIAGTSAHRNAEAIIEPASGAGVAITAGSGDVTVEGFTIIADAGIDQPSGVALDIEDNIITSTGTGVDISDAASAIVDDNLIASGGFAGINGKFVDGPVTIVGNTINLVGTPTQNNGVWLDDVTGRG